MQDITIAIPQSVENMQLPSPELLTFYKNLENRILWFDTDVDDVYLEFSRFILQWNTEDKGIPVDERKPIKIMIMSYGGELDIESSLSDVIRLSKTPVIGINMGVAASAGAYLYMSCQKRYALPNAYWLLHQGSGSFSGTYEQVCAQMDNYQRQINNLAKFILEHSTIDEQTLCDNISGEWYIDAEEAIKYGICHKIITDLDDIL